MTARREDEPSAKTEISDNKNAERLFKQNVLKAERIKELLAPLHLTS